MSEFRRGYLATLPIAASVAIFGLIFGVLAGQKGIGLVETGAMSALIFAGASQMLALELWTHPPETLGLAIAVFIINLRYVMQVAALKPLLGGKPALLAYGSIFFNADENWAVTATEMRAGRATLPFYVGTGFALWSFWVASSVIGRLGGSFAPDPYRWGLDFVGVAVFVALAGGLFRGRSDLLPWAAAALAAILAERWLGGTWYLLIGGLAGSLVGAWIEIRAAAERAMRPEGATDVR